MNLNLLRRRENENEGYATHDNSSDSDSDIEINNNCARRKVMSIPNINVLSTSESEEDYVVDALPPSSSNNMQWTIENVDLKFHEFNASNAGLLRDDIKFSSSVLDYFEIFFSSELVNFIVDKTNNYWAHTVNDNISNHNIGTTVNELYSFLACTLLMSRNKKLRLSEYWSRDRLLKSDTFTDIMSRYRYLTILQKLHFVNHNEKSSDRLHKISSVYNKLQKSFKDSFSPFQNLCIDESLLLFKGRLSFKQYISSKRS
ncbi:PREDICTED: piggyBac transposable element-derived protein 4-like [Polistes dominula]|uniref:PiggyBac transposable element-derived protein 4-like n=1 Tax=Polistes dominula TaxID=743375 RepID=A0ABM1J031_POLDO|nr:PREDICTED: piggyBac transposable element-derived protein 4-like [Polistes dominula]